MHRCPDLSCKESGLAVQFSWRLLNFENENRHEMIAVLINLFCIPVAATLRDTGKTANATAWA